MDIDHLLWGCQFSHSMWSKCLSSFGLCLACGRACGVGIMVEEALLNPPFRDKGEFRDSFVSLLYCGRFDLRKIG